MYCSLFSVLTFVPKNNKESTDLPEDLRVNVPSESDQLDRVGVARLVKRVAAFREREDESSSGSLSSHDAEFQTHDDSAHSIGLLGLMLTEDHKQRYLV
jgi:hypothetical protein